MSSPGIHAGSFLKFGEGGRVKGRGIKGLRPKGRGRERLKGRIYLFCCHGIRGMGVEQETMHIKSKCNNHSIVLKFACGWVGKGDGGKHNTV